MITLSDSRCNPGLLVKETTMVGRNFEREIRYDMVSLVRSSSTPYQRLDGHQLGKGRSMPREVMGDS